MEIPDNRSQAMSTSYMTSINGGPDNREVPREKNAMRTWLLVLLGFALIALFVKSTFCQDPVKVAPNNYTVLLENEQVRVLKSCLKPGEKIPMHSHPARVIYELTDQTSRFTFPTARPVESRSIAGEVKWGTPVTHSEENIGKTEGCALIVELKVRK